VALLPDPETGTARGVLNRRRMPRLSFARRALDRSGGSSKRGIVLEICSNQGEIEALRWKGTHDCTQAREAASHDCLDTASNEITSTKLRRETLNHFSLCVGTWYQLSLGSPLPALHIVFCYTGYRERFYSCTHACLIPLWNHVCHPRSSSR
jgi:hypothetical protein